MNKRITITLHETLLQLLDKMAEDMQSTQSHVIWQALAQFNHQIYGGCRLVPISQEDWETADKEAEILKMPTETLLEEALSLGIGLTVNAPDWRGEDQ